MHYFAQFFAGAFLCNCIPHLVSGLQGVPFPSPFATPRGVGNSSPPVNVLWGFFNLLVGVGLLSEFPVPVGLNPWFATLVAGAVVTGLLLSIHFGGVMARRRNPQTRMGND